MKYTIYTDGSYSSSRNQGGIAFIIIDNKGDVVARFSKGYRNTTNNRMELLSIIKGLETISEPSEIEIITDSQWCIGACSKGWKRKKNLDLLKRFDELADFHSVIFSWTKGHRGNKYNEECDKMAVEASQRN